MYYYAELNSDYLVIAKHALAEESDNANYFAITEDQYNEDIVGKYCNKTTGTFSYFEIGDSMGTIEWIEWHKAPNMPFSVKFDNYEMETQAELDGKADIAHTHSEYALTTHTHDYASANDISALQTAMDDKADIGHTHSEYAVVAHTHSDYAPLSHTHDDYVTTTTFGTLENEVDGKADTNHSHSDYALTSHTHSEYSEVGHSHSNYSETTHNHDDVYSPLSHSHTASEIGAAVSGHNHDDDYAAIDHAHTDYATTTALDELSTTVSGKANASHTHDDRYFTEAEINSKLADKADSSHTHTDVYDENGAAASALTSANAYTDTAIDALSETVATKANASDLTSHTGNTTVHITSTERTNWNAAKTHANSAHAPSNAEENQNAFSNVVVNGTTIAADSKMDTLTFVAGNNVTITPDATGDSITISSANTVYTHPTNAGNKHIPAGGSSGQILRWSADGTAVWGNDNNTTYSNATQTSSGLMSDTDKTKLDGIAEGANNYTLPSAGTALGGVKTGGDVTIASGVITVNDDSHNHVISNVDGLQSALDGKAASGHNHNDTYYTETEVDTLLSGKANSSHTHTIANITNLQTTLDGKANTSHGTHVSYSTTAPVMDGTAAVGTASTVARSDHKHPTDTSRAAQTSLDSHTSNKSNPHGVTLAQLGVTATAAELNKMDGVTATTTELNYVDGVTSNIQTQLNGKAASSHSHSTLSVQSDNYKQGTDLPSTYPRGETIFFSNNPTNKFNSMSYCTIHTIKGYNNMVCIQFAYPYNTNADTIYYRTALYNTDAWREWKTISVSDHTHNYAGSSSAGGAATSANKLNTNAGSTTQPVYFVNGIPVKTTYTLGASVPAGAKFTDTTYGVATTSANGLMSASDKSKLDGVVLATVSEVETYLGI